MELKPSQRSVIMKAIDDLFYTLKAKLLGPFFTGPRIYFEVVKDSDHRESLEGIYRYALMMTAGPGADPDKERIEQMAQITGNYIEKERLNTMNKLIMGIEGAKGQGEAREIVEKQLNRATNYVDLLLNTEIRQIQVEAEKDGIERLGAAIGVDDPTVVKLGQVDAKLCHACKDLWHRDDNIHMPKPYKLSELKGGYMSHKNPEATFAPSHPRCRHILTMVPPNFGFNSHGVITFKGFGYDYYRDWKK